MDRKSLDKAKSAAKQFCQQFGQYRMPLAWVAFPIVEEIAKEQDAKDEDGTGALLSSKFKPVTIKKLAFYKQVCMCFGCYHIYMGIFEDLRFCGYNFVFEVQSFIFFLQYICILTRGKFQDESFTNSEVTVKCTKFMFLENYHVYM